MTLIHTFSYLYNFAIHLQMSTETLHKERIELTDNLYYKRCGQGEKKSNTLKKDGIICIQKKHQN